MLKISETKINQQVEMALVVLSATARETKAKKPFLVLELFDGTDKITGNYWDWAGKAIPDKDAILNVTGQITEYNGTRQINVKTITTNTTNSITEFVPASGLDMDQVYQEAIDLAAVISDTFIRDLVQSILYDLKDKWMIIPGAKNVHHAYTGGTLVHSLSVGKTAGSIAASTDGANVDICIAGGLLHDLGKLFTYAQAGIAIDMTDEGMLLEHIFMGAEFVGNYAERSLPTSQSDIDKIQILRHVILSHHGKLEYGSPVFPMCIEAHIVSHADMLDAVAEQIRDASIKAGENKMTDRIYTLENRPHLSTRYVDAVMKQIIES